MILADERNTMRSFVKTIGTLLILTAVIGSVYYVYRARTEKQAGREYSVRRVPGDLARDVSALFASGESRAATPRPDRPGPKAEGGDEEGPVEAVPALPEASLYDRANEHYLVGRYADAEPLLVKALSTPGATGTRPAELLARTRLFRILLEGVDPESALNGPAIGYLVLNGGQPMLVQITEETADEVAFRAPGGIQSSLKKKNLRSVKVGRTRVEKTAIFELHYRLRHDGARTAEEFLELARFSAECGLTAHVTYCLERAIAAPGDAVEQVLTENFAAARQGSGRQLLIQEMFRRFYPRSDLTANLYTPNVSHLPLRRPGTEPPDESGPASGIGGVRVRKPRASDGQVELLLSKAAELRKEGDKYYRKAFDRGSRSTEYRDKALAAYRKAQTVYEQVEQKWDVGLDRTFKDIQTRVSDLIRSVR